MIVHFFTQFSRQTPDRSKVMRKFDSRRRQKRTICLLHVIQFVKAFLDLTCVEKIQATPYVELRVELICSHNLASSLGDGCSPFWIFSLPAYFGRTLTKLSGKKFVAHKRSWSLKKILFLFIYLLHYFWTATIETFFACGCFRFLIFFESAREKHDRRSKKRRLSFLQC